MKELSFTSLEKKVLHQMRERVNNAEDRIDLGNHFEFTVSTFLKKVFGKEVTIKVDDVVFNPSVFNHFTISQRLLDSQRFREVWRNSDLPNFIKRLADSTYHKYVHFGRHNERTDSKIRN